MKFYSNVVSLGILRGKKKIQGMQMISLAEVIGDAALMAFEKLGKGMEITLIQFVGYPGKHNC